MNMDALKRQAAARALEEVRDGMDSVSLDIRNSKNILFANYHGYRVTRSIKPALTAIRIANSSDVRLRNVHVNGESGFATCDENGCTTYARAVRRPRSADRALLTTAVRR